MSLDILDTNIQKCLNIRIFPLHLKKISKGSLCINFQVSFLGEKGKHLSFHQKLKILLIQKILSKCIFKQTSHHIFFEIYCMLCNQYFFFHTSNFQIYILIHKFSINLAKG